MVLVNLEGVNVSMLSGSSPRNIIGVRSSYKPVDSFADRIIAHGNLARGLSMLPAKSRQTISPL